VFQPPFERWRIDDAKRYIEEGIITLQDMFKEADGTDLPPIANELDRAIGEAGRAYSRLCRVLAKYKEE
jgi:hypothetical protein